MDGMPRKLPMFVVRERSRHGKVMFYFRRGKGERTRLPGVPGSDEFKAAYKAALMGGHVAVELSPAEKKGLRWLIARYMESAHWASLSAATKKQQGLFFLKAIEKSGNADFRAIMPRDIRNALEERKATPALANNYLKALNGLFKWAVINEHVDRNPCAGVERLKYKTVGFPAWTMVDAERFCAKWPIGTKPRLAFELLLLSGLRRSDVHRAGRQHMNGNVFSMRTMKKDTAVTLEFSAHLLNVISKTETGDLNFITGEGGKPYTKESFGNWFGERCREAGVLKAAHGVRKLSATMAADAGATSHELMAQYGWVSPRQADTYTKGADRARLGVKSSRMVAEHIEASRPRTKIPGKGKTGKNNTKTTLK